MREKVRINTVRTVIWEALHQTTGLTDLTLTVKKPDDTILTPAPTFTEQGNGLYVATYTPDAIGIWQEKVTSAINGDSNITAIIVTQSDADEVKTSVDSVESKVDNIDGDVATVDSKVDGVDTKVTTVDGKVDGVQSDVTTVKTKTDNLPTDTAQELTDIKTKQTTIETKIDDLDTQISKGNRFI